MDLLVALMRTGKKDLGLACQNTEKIILNHDNLDKIEDYLLATVIKVPWSENSEGRYQYNFF